MNYKWQVLGMKREMRKVIADAIGWAGHGWMKTGYTADVTETKREKKGKKKGDTPEYETDTVIKDESIWSYRVSPTRITFNNDEAIDPPYDCRWIAHELIKPLDTVKKMFPDANDLKASFITTYDAAKDSDGNKIRSYTGSNKSQSFDRSGIEMVRLYEITDMDTRQILLLADDYWKPLKDPREFPYEFKGFEYSMLRFNDVPDEPYPYSDLYAAEPQVWEITKLLSMALNHVKRYNRQLFMKKGAIDATEKAKMTQGIDGAVIEGSEPPVPIEYAQLQVDIYNILDRLQVIFDTIVGQSAFDRGTTAQVKTRTLGEVNQIQRATGTRSSEKLDIVEDFTEEVAEKQLSLIRQYTDVPEFVAVTGLDPAMLNKFLQPPTAEMMGKMADQTGFWFTKKDIEGKYDISVVAGSTKPLDLDYRNELLVQILRFGQALGFQPGDPASAEVGRELFQGLEMLGVEKAFEEKLQVMGVQQQLQKLQQTKQQMEQQVQQLQARGQQEVAKVQDAQKALIQLNQVISARRMQVPTNGGQL